MHINSYSFFLRLNNKFARTHHSNDLHWSLNLFQLLRSWADLNSVHKETTWIKFVEITIGLTFLGSLEDQWAQVFTDGHWTLWLLHGAERNQAILILHKLFCSLRVKLLVFNDPILDDSHILINFFIIRNFLFFNPKFSCLGLYILIFDLDDIFFVLIDDAKQFSLYLDEMIGCIVLIEEVHLFLEDEI